MILGEDFITTDVFQISSVEPAPLARRVVVWFPSEFVWLSVVCPVVQYSVYPDVAFFQSCNVLGGLSCLFTL